MKTFNLKKFLITDSKKLCKENNNGRSINENEEDLYIIDLCNGFFQLPKFVPSTSIRILPRIFRPKQNLLLSVNCFCLEEEITDELIVDYIKGLLTVVFLLNQSNKKNVFEDLFDRAKNSTKDVLSFDINGLHVSSDNKPYIDMTMKSFRGEDNFKITLSYIKNSNETFGINFVVETQEDMDINLIKEVNCLISKFITGIDSNNNIIFNLS